jgi:hypothetical protein
MPPLPLMTVPCSILPWPVPSLYTDDVGGRVNSCVSSLWSMHLTEGDSAGGIGSECPEQCVSNWESPWS